MSKTTRVVLVILAILFGFGVIASLIVLTVAVPQHNKARMNSQEMAAVAHVRTIEQTEIQYFSQFGKYAGTLAQLGPPPGGSPEGPNAASLIPAELASGSSGGYDFTLNATPAGYSLIAVPRKFNVDGRRTFYADQTSVIRQNWGQEPATANSPELR